MVGEQKLSLYGTRDAAMNWAKQYSQDLNKIWFRRGRASACNFVHTSRNIRLTCHGDDFIIVAPCKEIEWLVKEMEKEYELKYTIVGPEAGLGKEVPILNRRVRWTQNGIQYECDHGHADIVVGLLGMEGMRPLSSLGLSEIIDCFKKEEDKKKVTPKLHSVLLNMDLTLFLGHSRPEPTILPRIELTLHSPATV